jgi:ABC-type branched-subunit amino acid transport system ATPase component
MRFGSVQEFQGLKFETTVQSETGIAAIVGRNGAGKTRLFKAIAEGKVQVFVNEALVPQSGIRLLTINELQPGLIFAFDALQHREKQRQAVALYGVHRGKFKADPQQTISAIGSIGMPHRGGTVSIQQLAKLASHASQTLGTDINALTDADISDFFSDAAMVAMGSLNVTATMRTYWDRLEQNDFNEFRNKTHGEQRPYWPPEAFRARFGPPPWDLLNDVLRTVLDGRYRVDPPSHQNIAVYDARLRRIEDDLPIDAAWLSSGEKVLMWLCLSMYATALVHTVEPPKLLLLDEPDGALHPQMVQKLHTVLKRIANSFGSNIMFTTHSPTSVALFDAGPVWQVSENALRETAKDAAIRELLVGLDKVSIYYSKKRHVYVESHKDEDIYGELFGYLRLWRADICENISLSFIPAAPKLPTKNVRDLLKSNLGNVEPSRCEAFLQALNGLGDCAQVLGVVESLTAEYGAPVYGIVDWDLTNKPQTHIFVLGEGLFYNIESAVLNPLTLGQYLLHNFSSKLCMSDYGLPDGLDPLSLYTDDVYWQSIADSVTRRVLKVESVNHDIECLFFRGARVAFDRRYVHMNGHALEDRLREADIYPCLNALTRRPTLLFDVVQRGIQPSHGRTMPMAFADAVLAIQTDS